MKTPRSPTRWRDVANYQARCDHAGERTVEAALDPQRHCGTRYAANYLYSNNIALPVALRTLTRPQPASPPGDGVTFVRSADRPGSGGVVCSGVNWGPTVRLLGHTVHARPAVDA